MGIPPHARQKLYFLLCAAAAIVSFFFLDQEISRWFGQVEFAKFRRMARQITDIGLGEFWFGLAILLFLTSSLIRQRLKNPRLGFISENVRCWSIYFFFSLLFSGIALRVLKWAIGRQRPHMSEEFEPFVFDPMTHNWHFHSMPSGHTQILFTAATSALLLWPRAGWLFFSLAGLLSFTRVITLQHFLSDVIVGAWVGIIGTTLAQLWLAKKISRPIEVMNWKTNPVQNSTNS